MTLNIKQVDHPFIFANIHGIEDLYEKEIVSRYFLAVPQESSFLPSFYDIFNEADVLFFTLHDFARNPDNDKLYERFMLMGENGRLEKEVAADIASYFEDEDWYRAVHDTHYALARSLLSHETGSKNSPGIFPMTGVW